MLTLMCISVFIFMHDAHAAHRSCHLYQSMPPFTVEIKPENFPKVVLNSLGNIACVLLALIPHPCLTQRMEWAREGLKFRQVYLPSQAAAQL